MTGKKSKKKKNSRKYKFKAAGFIAIGLGVAAILVGVLALTYTSGIKIAGVKSSPVEELKTEEPAAVKPTAPKPTVEQPPPEKPVFEEPAAAVKAVPLKKIYVVIDDVGHNLHQLKNYADFPGVLTFAVLPGLAYTKEAAKLAASFNADIILHQPMEPVNGEDPGPGAIYTRMSEEEIRAALAANLEEIPGAIGLNNHMGSKATADERVMEEVLRFAKECDLLFLDSLTTQDSVAGRLADVLDLPFAKRSVFLDNRCGKEYIGAAVEEALTLTERTGTVVMIGHVWCDALAEYLKEHYMEITARGFVFSGISGVLKEGL